MSRRLIIVLSVIALLAVGGFFLFRYVTDDTPQAYATYAQPSYDPKQTDGQRIWALQNDLGNAAAEMAQLQEMAKKLQFGKMKAMGRHLQEVADELEPRLDDIQNAQAKVILAKGIDGLRTVGEGSEELDQEKSLQGVNDVLSSFEQMREVKSS